MDASPITTLTPGELVAHAVAFGVLVIAGIAAIVIAGAWWAACIAAGGLLLAVAGLIDVALALGRAGPRGVRRRAGGGLMEDERFIASVREGAGLSDRAAERVRAPRCRPVGAG